MTCKSVSNAFVLGKPTLVGTLFIGLVAAVGFDISTNFLFPDLITIFPFFREAFLLTLTLLLARQFKHKDLVWHIALLNLALFLSFFYGLRYGYYPIRTVAIIFVVRSVYQTMEKETFWIAILTLVTLFTFNVVFADRILIDQGQRFFAANATVVSTICIYLLVNRRTSVALMGLVGGVFTGSFAFLIALVTYIGKRPLIMGTLLAIVLPVMLVYVEDTQSGRRLEDFMASIENLDVYGLIESTTIGIRLDQFSWVVSNHFNTYLGAPISNQPGSSGLESQILFSYAYGGIVGSVLVVVYFLLVWWRYYSSERLGIFFFVILLLYATSIRIFESFTTIFYLALTCEALCAQSSKKNIKALNKRFEEREAA